ncbi:hypothetical protein [Cumulibacter soli]|uniref:hypothetical protein n=1 Tax=Cumulibacter soli TaxID=2546344 RepID=UPI00106822E6|nr:hypothetical protein [Cumulibacter soli]
MANPTRGDHTPAAVTAATLLLICCAVVGMWLAWMYDVVRVSALDPDLADRLGYVGERTAHSLDPMLQGISYDAFGVLFYIGIIGALIAYPCAVVARRNANDPAAVGFAIGVGGIGSALGFAWVSLDATVTEPATSGVLEQIVRYGVLWVPALMLAIAALCLVHWWRRAAVDAANSGGVSVPA